MCGKTTLALALQDAFFFEGIMAEDVDLFGSVQFSRSVMSDSLQPHGLQHAMLPCPSPTPRACLNSSPLSWWCHPTISSSVVPFSSPLQSFPASGSFQVSQFFIWGGQSIGVSASASVHAYTSVFFFLGTKASQDLSWGLLPGACKGNCWLLGPSPCPEEKEEGLRIPYWVRVSLLRLSLVFRKVKPTRAAAWTPCLGGWGGEGSTFYLVSYIIIQFQYHKRHSNLILWALWCDAVIIKLVFLPAWFTTNLILRKQSGTSRILHPVLKLALTLTKSNQTKRPSVGQRILFYIKRH